MKKKIWDLYAPVYERVMRSDRRIYRKICRRIRRLVKGMEVLELATGPGLIAKQVAPSTKRMVATDYSEGMIRENEKPFAQVPMPACISSKAKGFST